MSNYSSMTTAEVSILVTADGQLEAAMAMTGMMCVLGSVWIIEAADVISHRGNGSRAGVHRLGVKVTAPRHEVHEDAPIIADALRAVALPYDTLRVAVDV